MFKQERLDVWQEAIQFVCEVYHKTRLFPSEERFGLTNQVRRSSNSVAAKIAEGCSRSTDREYIRDLEIAYASLAERFLIWKSRFEWGSFRQTIISASANERRESVEC